jgi:hypothetical protein
MVPRKLTTARRPAFSGLIASRHCGRREAPVRTQVYACYSDVTLGK